MEEEEVGKIGQGYKCSETKVGHTQTSVYNVRTRDNRIKYYQLNDKKYMVILLQKLNDRKDNLFECINRFMTYIQASGCTSSIDMIF